MHGAFRSLPKGRNALASSRPAVARRGAGPQLTVEVLEDRTAPATFNVSGGVLSMAPVQTAPRSSEAPDEQLEAKLDAVLEKVSKHGQGSLTPEEREILFRASELFKKRRK